MRCVTEAAMVRASSGSLSSSGSYAVATAASMPASRYPSRRSVRMTRSLIFWRTAAMAASLGGSHLTNQRFLRVLTTIYLQRRYRSGVQNFSDVPGKPAVLDPPIP
jgi:hypothetical protein